MVLLYFSAVLMVLTAAIHSALGEKRLIQPILRLKSGITTIPLARQVLRFAWHFTSALMLLSALVVVWPGTPTVLIQVTGVTWFMVGFFDFVCTRGKHIGWPFISIAGIFAFLGVSL